MRDYLGALQALAKGHDSRRMVWQLDDGDAPRWIELVRRTGNLLIVVDEAHDIVGPSAEPSIVKFLRRPRHSRVDVVLIAQRPMRVNVSVRSQAGQVVAFNLTEPADLDWLRGHCGAEFGELVRDLGRYQAAEWRA